MVLYKSYQNGSNIVLHPHTPAEQCCRLPPEGFPLEPGEPSIAGEGPAAMDRGIPLAESLACRLPERDLRSRSSIRETIRQSDQTCFRRFLTGRQKVYLSLRVVSPLPKSKTPSGYG